MGKKGFDPDGDGPEFKRDSDRSDISPEKRKAFGKKMRDLEAEKARRKKEKEKEDAPPTEEELERGRRAQQHMNATQFKEPEDRGPNPHYIPPKPGEYGGPPLPKN